MMKWSKRECLLTSGSESNTAGGVVSTNWSLEVEGAIPNRPLIAMSFFPGLALFGPISSIKKYSTILAIEERYVDRCIQSLLLGTAQLSGKD